MRAKHLKGLAALLGLTALGFQGAASSDAAIGEELSIGIGDKLGPVGSLRDLRGNQRSLSDFKGYNALVLVIAGTECPLVNMYVPGLNRLEARYRPQRVKFLGVYPNEGDTLDLIAANADDRNIPFLQLKDNDQVLVDQLGIDRTGGIAVLDGNMVLRYRGRIDDQYSVSSRKAAPSREDLVTALDQLLEGVKIAVPETPIDGCLFDRGSAPELAGITFSKHVAPILQKRCESCHRPGQIGPFPLVTYQDAVKWKSMVEEVVTQRRMPPWHADKRYGDFRNERSMTDEEVAIVQAWVDTGTPRGNPADLPPPMEWPAGGWVAGVPDVILSSPKEIDVPADGVMEYIYLPEPLPFEEDVWVKSAEIRPSDPSVLHHILAYILPPGTRSLYARDGTTTALVGWVPGDNPMESPEGTAVKIEAGSQIVWELHYTPNGKATTDRSSMGLILTKEPPEREAVLNIFANRRIQIEPESPHHEHVDTFEFKEDSRLISLMPHMHVRGKSYKYEAIYPDGRTETILSVPRWDFYWQTEYLYDELPFMPKGTKIRATARWDNSDNNILNPGPTEEVRYGLQTFEEMMNGWVRYVPDKAGTKN